MQAQAIQQVEGVPPARGYRLVYFYELDAILALVPKPLAAELRSAAAAHLERRNVRANGAYCFKFWPAPSQQRSLALALATVRS